MTVNWYKPSQCILVTVTVSSIVVCLGCLACGYLLHFAPEEPSRDVNGGNYTFLPAVCFAALAGLSLIALLIGCCGIIGDSRIVLVLFAAVALVVAVGLLGSSSSVFAFMLTGSIESQMKPVLLNQLRNFSTSGNLFKDKNIQEKLECCGVDGHEDWKNSSWYQNKSSDDILAPSSCCIQKLFEDHCANTSTNLYQQGCLQVLYERMEFTVFPVFGLGAALSLVEVAVAIQACYGVMIISRYKDYDVL